jgi:hypothetical protein
LNLSPAQLSTLKTWLTANANGQTDEAAAALLNANASPDFWVWRTKVTKSEYVNSTSIDATVFSWTGTGFITRAQGERDAWREMFNGREEVNPTLAQVRTAFTDIFSGGTAPAPANRTHLATVSRRKATVAEKLYATGTGSTASPAVLAFDATGVTYAEGLITTTNVSEARNA